MPMMPPTLRGPGQPTRQEAKRESDKRRGSARDRGYDSRWDKASASHRRAHPLCEYCGLVDQVTAATLIDHLYPHRQYDGVFWRKEWWVSSCDDCHNGYKQALERRGRLALDDLARRLGRPVL